MTDPAGQASEDMEVLSGRTTSYEEATAEKGAAADTTVDLSGKHRKKEAQKAFKAGDSEYSKAVHEQLPQVEEHDKYGEFLKVMVFGGLDGIVTTFAVVSSIAGADLKTEIVLIMGFANLLGDGVSMAFGEFISGDAEQKYAQMEQQRERWEFENDPEGERREMVDLYVAKGFDKDDAESVINTMSKYDDFFVNHMMTEELNMMPPEPKDEVFRELCKQSAVMFFSFLIFGLVPLLSYLCLQTIGLSKNDLFGISIGLTGCALFGLGAYSSKFSKYPWYRQGFFVLANGGFAAAVAYGAGAGVGAIVDVGDC